MKLFVLCLGVKNCYVTINLLLHNKCITKRLKCLLELGVTWFSPLSTCLYTRYVFNVFYLTSVNNLLRLVKVLLFRFTFHIIKAHFEYREIKWEELKKNKTKQNKKTKQNQKKNQIQNVNFLFLLEAKATIINYRGGGTAMILETGYHFP